MQADELLHFSALGENSFIQENLIEAKPSRISENETKLDVAAIPDAALFAIPLGFMMVWVIVLFVFSDIWPFRRHKALTIKHCPKVPCRNCRFFTNNPYLKCAVHPSTALTDQALNCSDYSPEDEDC
jgi:hypothetical protein